MPYVVFLLGAFFLRGVPLPIICPNSPVRVLPKMRWRAAGDIARKLAMSRASARFLKPGSWAISSPMPHVKKCRGDVHHGLEGHSHGSGHEVLKAHAPPHPAR